MGKKKSIKDANSYYFEVIMKFCPECGNSVEGYKFCPNCGYSIANQEPTEQAQPVDKTASPSPAPRSRKRTKSDHLRLIDM